MLCECPSSDTDNGANVGGRHLDKMSTSWFIATTICTRCHSSCAARIFCTWHGDMPDCSVSKQIINLLNHREKKWSKQQEANCTNFMKFLNKKIATLFVPGGNWCVYHCALCASHFVCFEFELKKASIATVPTVSIFRAEGSQNACWG